MIIEHIADMLKFIKQVEFCPRNIYNITELYNPFIINSNIDVRPRRVEIILASMYQSLMSTLQ